VEIKATPGSLIGPKLRENGYLLKEIESGLTLLRASRVSFPSLQKAAPVDVVLTPLLDLALPLVGPIIKGRKSALEVAETCK